MLTVLAKVRRKQASKTIHFQSEEEYKPHETGAVNREIGNVSTQNYMKKVSLLKRQDTMRTYMIMLLLRASSPTQPVLPFPSSLMCLSTTVRWLKDL